jgi:hypothetical protein
LNASKKKKKGKKERDGLRHLMRHQSTVSARSKRFLNSSFEVVEDEENMYTKKNSTQSLSVFLNFIHLPRTSNKIFRSIRNKNNKQFVELGFACIAILDSKCIIYNIYRGTSVLYYKFARKAYFYPKDCNVSSCIIISNVFRLSSGCSPVLGMVHNPVAAFPLLKCPRSVHDEHQII